ncbi:hypothetical protein GRAN_1916 [Granulicella sibirica]|uniref:Uncharacterized protein n=1 Tax=Granulicella sibirica TaxID=2479048 RepID=A0A4Q0TA12_9BACT|nr:hypothetical protein GRAN_1916 [Granulicella sibirica]
MIYLGLGREQKPARSRIRGVRCRAARPIVCPHRCHGKRKMDAL